MADVPYDYIVGRDKEWLKQHPGRQTGSITKAVEFPVKWLVELEGLRGEDKKLKFSMSKIKGMAESYILSEKWRADNPMILEVHHDGDVYIFDGNHRARAAKLAGLDTYPCKVKFYGGSEDKFNVQKILNKYTASLESEMTAQEKRILQMANLITTAKIAIQKRMNHQSVIAQIEQLATESGGNIGGDVDSFGTVTDQEYQNSRDGGIDYGGQNDPNKHNERRTGPREPNDMMQEASSNKPCKDCGMPTDKCVCMKSEQPTNGKNPANTAKRPDPQLDPGRSQKTAAFDMILALIKDNGKMTREASHMEEIEIPFSELKLEDGIDYNMSGATQHVSMLVDKYLRANVYHGNRRYTIARIEQSANKLFVKILVFDRQIEHEGSFDTKGGRLNKVSNVKSNKLRKTAWKMRVTEVIGENDDTGLVRCPIEGGFLTRSCGTCPFAGNPRTYVVDGGTECHFDEGSVWLNNLGVKEHRTLDNSSNL